MTNTVRRLRPLTTFSILVACVPNIQAQTASPEAIVPDSSQLSEITVTAQRRAESIMVVPVSVTALTAANIENSRITRVTDLVGYVPGLQAVTNYGDENPEFSLRGISASDISLSSSGPVAEYVDGVYRSASAFFSKQMYDLDRIEVLRGPQGTLYGKNATGGAIDFITQKPGFDSDGYLNVNSGNYNLLETSGAVQGKLSDGVAARLAFATAREGGYVENVNPDVQSLGRHEDYGIRLSILYTPSETLEALLRIATSQVIRATVPNSVTVPPAGVGYSTGAGVGNGLYASYHSLYPAVNPNTDYLPTYGRWRTAATAPTRTDGASHDVTLTMTWHAAQNLNVVSVSSYNRGFFSTLEDADGSSLQVLSDNDSAKGDQLAEDLRIEGSGPALTYVAGLYASRDRLEMNNGDHYFSDLSFDGGQAGNAQNCLSAVGQGLYPYGCANHDSLRQTRESQALYVDGSYRLTDKFSLVLGARYSRDTLRVSNYNAYLAGDDETPVYNTIPGGTAGIYDVFPSFHQTWEKPTGRVGLEYHIDGASMLYAMVSRGYRSGAVNGVALDSPQEVTIAAPETLDSAELGAKGEYLDHRLRVTAAAFYYRYKGQQALSVDPVTFVTTLINLQRSHVRGAELESTAKITPKLTVYLGLSLLASRVDEATVSGVNLAGFELANAPKISGNLGADWDALTLDSGKLTLHVDERYIGRQFQDIYNTSYLQTSPYFIANFRASWHVAQQPLTVSLWTNNAFNRYYVTNAIDASGFGFLYIHPGQPRTYGADLAYHFGR
jgi:iron complex outermembrane receptor protein